MVINISEIFTCFITLFVIIDIVGSIPIIVDLRKKSGRIESEKATIVAGSIMILFALVGESLLNGIGIDLQSFAVAGSIVLFLIALEMILGVDFHENTFPQAASIVPLAFPLVAGAGSLTSILSLRAENHITSVIIGILLNLLCVYLTLKSTKYIELKIGKAGLSILQKVFGIILMAIAVKLFTANIGQLLNH